MVVWIRFPRLPYQYYHSGILASLGNLVGRTVRLDKRTLTSARGKFARLAVEINLHKPIAIGVFLNDVWQKVDLRIFQTSVLNVVGWVTMLLTARSRWKAYRCTHRRRGILVSVMSTFVSLLSYPLKRHFTLIVCVSR
ncbi:hypothetical protein LINGRAHAP2_LOCUS28984 [Linum grandiflorum]